MRITCTCGKVLQVDGKLFGKKVRCPGCKEVLLVKEEELVAKVEDDDEEEERPRRRSDRADSPRRPPKVQRPAKGDQDLEEDKDRPRRKKKARKETASFSPVLLWSLAGGGVAAVGILVLVLFMAGVFGGKASTEKGPIAKKDDSGKKTDNGSGQKTSALGLLEKSVPARLEWNREVIWRGGGPMSFRVTSSRPFAVTLVTDKGYQASKRGQFDKTQLLLTIDCQPPQYERSISVSPGTFWFIIENQSNETVEMTLEVFDLGKE